VAGVRYYTATGPLPATRETESHRNNPGALDRVQAVVAGARQEGAWISR
jgi:hypothetical protein